MTNEMNVQVYLRSGGGLDGLTERYAIKATRSIVNSHLVLFKYNQIESPFAEPIVRECRGLILDESEGWCVVSRSFDKFFNHGEGHAAPIDWSSARVQESSMALSASSTTTAGSGGFRRAGIRTPWAE